ncbi:MAG: OsmC family protein [Ignavibacteria bacterium]|nr:OsmC family protein [Ignavibacteria bacterium]
MGHTINAKYKSGMAFDIDVLGHKITVDVKPEGGGNNEGPTPKPLMLASLAGCTGMDVVFMLKKMKVQFESFSLKIDGELNDEHPKKYTKMHITYQFTGKDVPFDKVENAVKLSMDKYCGVSAVYRKAVEMSYSIEINGITKQ